jgi:hypothetical protein
LHNLIPATRNTEEFIIHIEGLQIEYWEVYSLSKLLPEKWLITTIDKVTINTEQRKPQQDESFVYIDIGSG